MWVPSASWYVGVPASTNRQSLNRCGPRCSVNGPAAVSWAAVWYPFGGAGARVPPFAGASCAVRAAGALVAMFLSHLALLARAELLQEGVALRRGLAQRVVHRDLAAHRRQQQRPDRRPPLVV